MKTFYFYLFCHKDWLDSQKDSFTVVMMITNVLMLHKHKSVKPPKLFTRNCVCTLASLNCTIITSGMMLMIMVIFGLHSFLEQFFGSANLFNFWSHDVMPILELFMVIFTM